MSTQTTTLTKQEAFYEYLVRLADDRLILGHRLSEWCGHGPILEEDIALANVALDNIGHAAALYEYAAEIEGEAAGPEIHVEPASAFHGFELVKEMFVEDEGFAFAAHGFLLGHREYRDISFL